MPASISVAFTVERKMPTPSGPRVERLTVGVYVDDLAVIYDYDDSHSLYAEFVAALGKWNVEDEGELADLLGVDFTRDGGVVKLSQTKYIHKLFTTYLPEGKPAGVDCSTPCGADLEQLVLNAMLLDRAAVDPALLKQYQSIVGALLYCATNTRPDVAFSIGMLCRAMARPTPALLAAAHRVLCYLHSTSEIGLRYERSEERLYGMSDSNWATRHSTSGHVFMQNLAAVSWSSRKQASVALSSCEAEIVAASEAARESVHISRLATELGLHDGSAIDLHVDNKSAIDVAYNPEHHTKMKHVDRRHFYVRELVENHRLRVPFVSTVNNIADFFTKSLPPKQFTAMRDRIMNVPQ